MRLIPRPAADFAAILESLFDGIESLDTTGYAWRTMDGKTSDRWRQSRTSAPGDGDHLALLIGGDGATLVSGSEMLWPMVAIYQVRWIPDRLSLSQSRAMASAYDLWHYLREWSARDCRASPGSIRIRVVDTERAEITLSFDLRVPWRT